MNSTSPALSAVCQQFYQEIEQQEAITPSLALDMKKAEWNIQYILSGKDIDADKIAARIHLLKRANFDKEITLHEQKIWIKYHAASAKHVMPALSVKAGRGVAHSGPISPYEAQVQALQYLRGMYLIYEHTSEKNKQSFKDSLQNVLEEFSKSIASRENKIINEKDVIRLEEDFAEIIRENILSVTDNKKKVDLKKQKKYAHMQLTMARDLALMRVSHPAVCTITESKDHELSDNSGAINISAEYANNVKISKDFYDEDAGNFQHEWLAGVKKNTAGFAADRKNTWLDNFFEKGGMNLREYQSPAPPSARWLELPANFQEMQHYQTTKNALLQQNLAIEKEEGENVASTHLKAGYRSDFVRIGTPTSFLIKKNNLKEQTKLQTEIAIKQVKEMIASTLKAQIDNYCDSYGDLATDTTFYVDYVNILSPLSLPVGEENWKHVDNNTRFIMIAKAAFAEIQKEYTAKKNFSGKEFTIKFMHTNSAINKYARFSRVFEKEDNPWIKEKFANVDFLVQNLLNNFNFNSEINNAQNSSLSDLENSEKLSNLERRERADRQDKLKLLIASELDKNHEAIGEKESLLSAGKQQHLSEQQGKPKREIASLSMQARKDMAMRIRAAHALKSLLSGKDENLKKLDKYQKNLLSAALQLLMQGQQSLKLVGCKSARDRTAIIMGAVRVMQENPAAMSNWSVLQAGITQSLEQGQHFRAMSYHVSSGVKVDDVHKVFMQALSKETQEGIKKYKRFTKVMSALKVKKAAKKGNEKVQQATKEKKMPIKIEAEKQELQPAKSRTHEKTVNFAPLLQHEKQDDTQNTASQSKVGTQISITNEAMPLTDPKTTSKQRLPANLPLQEREYFSKKIVDFVEKTNNAKKSRAAKIKFSKNKIVKNLPIQLIANEDRVPFYEFAMQDKENNSFRIYPTQICCNRINVETYKKMLETFVDVNPENTLAVIKVANNEAKLCIEAALKKINQEGVKRINVKFVEESKLHTQPKLTAN